MRSQTKVRLRWNALAGAWTIQEFSLVVAQWSAPPCPESSGPRPVGKVVFASQLNGEDASGPRPFGEVSSSRCDRLREGFVVAFEKVSLARLRMLVFWCACGGAAVSCGCAGSGFALVEGMAGFGGVISPPLVTNPSICRQSLHQARAARGWRSMKARPDSRASYKALRSAVSPPSGMNPWIRAGRSATTRSSTYSSPGGHPCRPGSTRPMLP